MKNAFFACLICCFFAVSCHRPYALYQRMPVENFREPLTATAAKPLDSRVEETTSPAISLPDSSASEPTPTAYAAVTPLRTTEPAERVRQHVRHASRLLGGVTTAGTVESVEAQPRPKPRTQTSERKTLREILGLKPRPKLNWWQRIHWSLKASVPVILVAVIFALLKINILAIIFGLLGAFLLIRGLKKEFKVRRPWF